MSGARTFHASIIIITKNRPDSLRTCIDSILSQTLPFSECIIIDGSSNDATKRAIMKIRHAITNIRYVRDKTPGYAAPKNTGIRIASSTWVAFTDDDCTLNVSWLSSMSSFVWASPGALAITGLCTSTNFNSPVALAMRYYELLWKRPAIDRNRIIDPEILDTKNVLFRASVIKKLAFRQEKIDNTLLSTDDIDMGMQIGEAGVSAMFNSNAVVRHADPTTLRDLLNKLRFDRISYRAYEKRWGSNRRKYKSRRIAIPKKIILDEVFRQHATPKHLQILTIAAIKFCDRQLSRSTEGTL